jgi:hypothetical protein
VRERRVESLTCDVLTLLDVLASLSDFNDLSDNVRSGSSRVVNDADQVELRDRIAVDSQPRMRESQSAIVVVVVVEKGEREEKRETHVELSPEE